MRRSSLSVPLKVWVIIIMPLVAVFTIISRCWVLSESTFYHPAMQLAHGSMTQRNRVAVNVAPLRYAYVFYVTDNAYGCGALVNMARLREAEGGMPDNVDLIMVAKDGAVSASILEAAERDLGAIIYPTSSFGTEAEMEAPVGGLAGYYADCFLKFKVFLLPADVYRRLILMDADSLVLRPPHHLFQLPDELPLAAPSAYWLRPQWVSVTNWLMSVRPSRELYEILRTRLQELQAEGRNDVYDMDLFNIVFEKDITVLPPVYGMLDSELVENDHKHLGPLDTIMNGTNVWAVHFSGGGKPMLSAIDPASKQGAHPSYTRLIEMWTDTARRVCPSGTFPLS